MAFRAYIFIFTCLGCTVLSCACDPDDMPCLEARATAHPEDLETRMQLGLVLVNAAIIGSETAAARAIVQFDAVLAKRPRDAFARVNRGWAITFQARDAKGITERLRLARRGFGEMDAAVKIAPSDAAVRLVRAINAYQMPLALDRGEIAKEDFRFLLAEVDKPGGALAVELRRRVLFHAASFALKERRIEAISLLERAAREPAKNPSDEQVQSMLALARREFTPQSHADAEDSKQTSPP